jgi:hypothetical protein
MAVPYFCAEIQMAIAWISSGENPFINRPISVDGRSPVRKALIVAAREAEFCPLIGMNPPLPSGAWQPEQLVAPGGGAPAAAANIITRSRMGKRSATHRPTRM